MPNSSVTEIQTQSVTRCPVCGSEGELLYSDLKDRTYSAPGLWRIKKCIKDCGTLWLDPAPVPEEISKAYQGYYTHVSADDAVQSLLRRVVTKVQRHYLAQRYHYTTEPEDGSLISDRFLGLLPYLHPGLKSYLDFSVMYIPAAERGRLLDIGCGNGEALLRMQNLGWTVEGVEVDVSAAQYATANGLKVHVGTLEQASLPVASYDAITISHVIEHVHDPRSLLLECHRLLKPGGRVVIVTPNVSSMMHRWMGCNWLALDPPRHLCIFTPKSLADVVRQAGFENLSVITTVREANIQFIAGRLIGITGRYEWGQKGSVFQRLAGQVIQYAEPLGMAMGLCEGEEILLIGRK